jgi:hypothetical protein
MSVLATAEAFAPSDPVCMCYPLLEGCSSPWSSKCDLCLVRVRDWGYRYAWYDGCQHSVLFPPGCSAPIHCPDHAPEAYAASGNKPDTFYVKACLSGWTWPTKKPASNAQRRADLA